MGRALVPFLMSGVTIHWGRRVVERKWLYIYRKVVGNGMKQPADAHGA